MKKRMAAIALALGVLISSMPGSMEVSATETVEATEATETAETETTEPEVTETVETAQVTETAEPEVTETGATETVEATETTEPEATETVETEATETEITESVEATEIFGETEATEFAETSETDEIIVTEEEVVSEEKISSVRQMQTGLLPMQEMTAASFDESQVYQSAEEEESDGEVETSSRASNKYQSDWDVYSTNYYYNQLSSEEKEVWDDLNEICLAYLEGTDDAEETGYTDSIERYATKYVDVSELTSEEASNLVYMFRFSNPQYYFLNTFVWKVSYNGTLYRAIGMYSAFGDGDARKTATAQVKAQAESMVSQAAQYATEEEKAKVLHDLIVNKVDYNYDILGTSGSIDMSAEDSAYTQSAYSVFCLDLTVCAGYAQAYEMVCNAAGVDCIVTTSTGHEWNKVRINDSWYNVDCTWADNGAGNPIYYDYYARSDAAYASADSNYGSYGSHVTESFWEGYLPSCTLDSNPADAYTAGSIPAVTETTAAPAITISDGKAVITSSTSGAVIYYTTDGTTPAPAASRCTKYTGKFKVASGKTVKAVAVSDGRWDSSVASKKNASSVKYKVVFKGNGSTSGEMPKQTMTYGSGKKLTANKFKRKGYTFTGWNTKADGSGKSYKNKADGSKLTKTNGKTIKLYAQWKVNKYTIKYNGNGSTSGKMSAKKNCKYGKKYTLAANAYKKKGYTFVGWNTKKDGSGKSYKNKAQVKNLTTKSGGTVTLYAQWKKK